MSDEEDNSPGRPEADMNSDTRERRQKMVSLVYRGVEPYKAAEKVADQYDDIKKKSLQQDWSRRDKWMPHLLDWEDDEDVVTEIIRSQKTVRKELWKMYRSASNEGTKLGALNRIAKLNKDMLGMLQDAGRVVKEPDKLDVRADVRVREELMKYYKDVDGVEEEEIMETS